MVQQIQFCRGTAAEWAAADPVLGSSEPGFETDTRRLKVGDGSTAWASLSYFAPLPLKPTGAKTGAYAASPGDMVNVDATSAPITVTLPTGAKAGDQVGVRRADATTNVITVQRGGTDLIASGTGTATSTSILLQDSVQVFLYDGSGTWTVTGGHRSITQLDARFRALDPAPPSTYYAFTASPANTTTSNTHGIGTLRVLPWIVGKTITLSRLGAEVVTIGDTGSKIRLGIYADNGNGSPGALVVDAGQIAGDSATIQELTISTTLSPGLYWVGGVVQAVTTTQPTLRTVNNWHPPVTMSVPFIPTANQTTVGFINTGVTGVLPGTFPAGSFGSGQCARTFIKVA